MRQFQEIPIIHVVALKFKMTDSVQGCCEKCISAERELEDLKTEKECSLKNLHMLKAKIVATDLLIKDFAAKSRELEANVKKKKELSLLVEQINIECRNKTEELSIALRDREVLHKANEKLAEENMRCAERISKLENDMLAAKTLQDQYKERMKQVESEETAKNRSVEQLRKQLQAANKEAANAIKSAEELKKSLLEKKAEEKILQKKSASCKTHLLQFGRILKNNGLLTGKSLRIYERYVVPHDTNSASECNESECDADGDKLQQLLLMESGNDRKADVETQTMTDTTSTKIDCDLELEILLDMIPSMFIVPRNFRPLSPLPLSPKPCRRKVPKNHSGHKLRPKENSMGNVTDVSKTNSEPIRSEQVNSVRNAVLLEKDGPLTLDVVLEADIAVLDRTLEDHQVAQNVPENIEIDITSEHVDAAQDVVVITSPHKVAVVIDSPHKVTLITNTLVVPDAILSNSSMEETVLPCISPEIIDSDAVTPITTDSKIDKNSTKAETIISPAVYVCSSKLVMEVDIGNLERPYESNKESDLRQISPEVATVDSDEEVTAATIDSFTAVVPLNTKELPVQSPEMAICPDQEVNADATTDTTSVKFDPSNQETLRCISPKVINSDQEITDIAMDSNARFDSSKKETAICIIPPGNVNFDLEANAVSVKAHVDPFPKESTPPAISPEDVHTDKETAMAIDSNGKPDDSNKDPDLKNISPELEPVGRLDQEAHAMVIASNVRPDNSNNSTDLMNNSSPKHVVISDEETAMVIDSNGKPDDSNKDPNLKNMSPDPGPVDPLDQEAPGMVIDSNVRPNVKNYSHEDVVKSCEETAMVIDTDVRPDNSKKDPDVKNFEPVASLHQEVPGMVIDSNVRPKDVTTIDINPIIPVSEFAGNPAEDTMSEDFEPLMIVMSPSGHEESVDPIPACTMTVDPSSHSDQNKILRENNTRGTPCSPPTLRKDTKAKPVSSDGHLRGKKHFSVSFLKAGRVSKQKLPVSIALSLCVSFTKLGNTVKEGRLPDVLSHPGERLKAGDEVTLVKGRLKRSASRERKRKHKRPRITVTEHQQNTEILPEPMAEEELLRISPFHVPSPLSPLQITPPKLNSKQSEGAERLAPKLTQTAPRRNLSVSLTRPPTANTTNTAQRLLSKLTKSPAQLNQKLKQLQLKAPQNNNTKCFKAPSARAKSSQMSIKSNQKQLPAPLEMTQKQLHVPAARSDVDIPDHVMEDGVQEHCEEGIAGTTNSYVWCSQSENCYLKVSEADKWETEFGKQEAWKFVMRIKKARITGKDFLWAKLRSCFEEESFSGSVRQVAKAAVAQLFYSNDTCTTSDANEGSDKGLFTVTGREMKVLKLLDTLCNSRKGEDFHREMLREMWCAMMTCGKRPVSLMVAVCRTFVHLCRQKDDSQKVRVLCHDLLYNSPDVGIATVTNAVITWPEAFSTSRGGESPLRRVIRWVLINKNGPYELDTVYKAKVQENIGLVVQSLDQLTGEFLQLIRCTTSDGPVLLESVQALQLLAVHCGWQWTNDVLVRQHLWPILQCWAQTNSAEKPDDKVASNVIYLIGCLTRLCPLEDKSPATEVIKTMKALLSQSSAIAVADCVQESAVLVLLILKPFHEEMVTAALKEWWEKDPSCKSLSASTLRLLQSANIQ